MGNYEIFEKLLKERNIRPADVTRATGISSVVFSEWKKGKSSPKFDKLKKIADYFNVTVDYLNGVEKSITPTLLFENDREAEEFLRLLSYLEKINYKGMEDVNRYLSYISTLEEYTTPDENMDVLEAAHERTDVETTKEGVEHDNAIMNDDKYWKK